MILTSEGETAIKATKANAIDPTGAGDAYRAGFAKAYLLGLPLSTCAQLASTVAAFAVEKQGTQGHVFTIDQIKSRYQDAYGQALEI